MAAVEGGDDPMVERADKAVLARAQHERSPTASGWHWGGCSFGKQRERFGDRVSHHFGITTNRG